MKTPFRARACFMLLTATAIFLAGCLPSVHPLYTDKDLVANDAVVGLWAETGKEKGQFWKIEKTAEKEYTILVTEEAKRASFNLRLVRLDGKDFLDIQADPGTLDNGRYPDLFQASIIPGHLFFKYKLEGKSLKLAFFGGDAVDEELKAHPDALACVKSDGRVVITASTVEIQKFVLRMYNRPNAFADECALEKVKSK